MNSRIKSELIKMCEGYFPEDILKDSGDDNELRELAKIATFKNIEKSLNVDKSKELEQFKQLLQGLTRPPQ